MKTTLVVSESMAERIASMITQCDDGWEKYNMVIVRDEDFPAACTITNELAQSNGLIMSQLNTTIDTVNDE